MVNKDHQNKNKESIDKIKKAKVKTVNTDRSLDEDDVSVITQEQQNRMVAAVINGVANASGMNQSPLNFPQNGRTAAVSATNSSRRGSSQPDDSSTVTFDHLGNHL